MARPQPRPAGGDQHPYFQWTAERHEWLKVQILAGRSASDIARELGVSRASICGKAYRLREKGDEALMMRRRNNVPHRAAPKAPRPPKVAKSTFANLGSYRPHSDRAAPTAIAKDQGAGKLTMMELTAHTCRWPFGDPREGELTFCGDLTEPHPTKASERRPYCARHMSTMRRAA